MWRVEVTEVGRTPLPPIDLELEELVLGSGEGCGVRLPAAAVRPQHLRLRRLAGSPPRVAWSAGHALVLEEVQRPGGSSGELPLPLQVAIGGYRVRVSEAPETAVATSPQRTESLARELIRNIMGGGAPRLVVEVGPAVGSSRTLAPPESRLTVGRGDEADWVILDEDLSRVHAALLRTWDGVVIVDLGSKNGTLVDGVAVPLGESGRPLRDGARIALGDVIVRYHDDAERYLEDVPPGELAPEVAAPAPEVAAGSAVLLWAGVAVVLLAVGASVWLLVGG